MQTIENATATIKEIWAYQHPVMHTWFVLSSLSLCVMFALLYFVIQVILGLIYNITVRLKVLKKHELQKIRGSCFVLRLNSDIYILLFFSKSFKPSIKINYGTGSYPPAFPGWHLQIRFSPSQPPFKIPYFTIACLVYSEHVG